jgi:hypothetical protein
MADPIAFAASSNPDTMYLHQALRAPDRNEFIKAMQREIKDHEDMRHWELIPKADVPEGTTILPSVWSSIGPLWTIRLPVGIGREGTLQTSSTNDDE